jgi:hypothetical protein
MVLNQFFVIFLAFNLKISNNLQAIKCPKHIYNEPLAK